MDLSDYSATRASRFRTSVAIVALCGALFPARSAVAQPNVQGQWRTLPTLMPINPIHTALMKNGKVLLIAGSGNQPSVSFQGAVWDPVSGAITPHTVGWDMFCNDMINLPDGTVLINGGNLQYDPFLGLAKSSIYDPIAGTYTDIADMVHGRWYPTLTMLGDGRVITYSGLTETGSTNETVEIYTPGIGWSPEYPSGWTPPLYPRQHLLPNGTVFYSGPGPGSRFFNPSTKAWTGVVATTNHGGSRLYGSSVLLPLSPADGYKPRVMIMGGGSPSTATTELIDLSVPNPKWQYGPPMSQPRVEMNATLLPNGKVLTVGGSLWDEDATTASLNADLYNPKTNTFSSAGANAFPRLYHSVSMLLPDATVMLFGGNPSRGVVEPHIELYTPPYLLNADGSLAPRPTIGSVPTSPITYGETFQVSTSDAASISSVVLMRPGTPTHSFDNEQRLVELTYTAGSGVLSVTAPPHGNIAPPGYYLLFVLNAAGVPSVAKYIQILPTTPFSRPIPTILAPADTTIPAGGSVFFAGSGIDPSGIGGYSWTFPGANPASASTATPGNATYGSPGIYVASLGVTNTLGVSSQVPSLRIVTVTDFSVAAGPPSQNVLPAGSATYGVGITGQNGFSGTATFGVTGLPAGATASFVPPSIAGSGMTGMTIQTTAATPFGTYPLTITGTSGAISHTANVTLVVGGCVDMITPSYASPTLNIGFKLGTLSPATWATWAIVNNTVYPLWSISVPVMSPAVPFNIPVTPFPNVGLVYVLSTLTPTSGAMCWDLKAVNTSP
jgi:Galactose oxidase-like, Early set domain